MTKINLTTQRKAILEAIQDSHDHPTAADVIERLRDKGISFAYGTVYNSLRYLSDAGLIRELKLGEAVSRYDARMDDHHHIMCKQCGRVEEVLTELPEEWLRKIAAETKFTVQDAHVVLEGVCELCASR
ncbi:Fur family transcriptional regulator, peroxide stress response regulator [Paenibacillus catalpae]|uniref:Fur family transcriptional regulator, peroxide stress response regulator n=1 Tax=Paenibacillus catalpae TaxID=1045775 RepID=A0A1I2H1A9_9BACL|nr:transcriptional repressor [Paenibacillus catalpae]SFF22596.1 Fur family transcriptional regulator, peroxide stress response regulator [Paenibacillus catalpae]